MKRLKIHLYLLLVLLIFAGIPTKARANPIYSTFGPGDSYGDLVWGVGEFYTGFNYSIVTPFTPTNEGFLSSIELALSYKFGTNELTVDLTTDNGGLPSSTIIESFSFSGIDPKPGGIYSQTSTINPFLSSGTTYWLVATVSADSLIGWYLNNIGATGVNAYELSTGTWVGTTEDTAPAFRLNPVPEPATILLLCSGLIGLAWYGRKRRKVRE